MMSSSSWLFDESVDRERMVDMDLRLQPVRMRAFIVLAIALLLMGPWYGYWTLGALAAAGLGFRLADWQITKLEFPERAIFAAWAGSELIIAISVALTGGLQSPAFCWFAVPVITLSARFSSRGIMIGVFFTLALMLGVTFGFDWVSFVDNPSMVFTTGALVVATAMLSTALMHSDREHRSEAVIDPLTGLLNRKALLGRANELAQQSAFSGRPVGMIVADLDHFKKVNDAHGHAVGDAVLHATAEVFRHQLRAFDMAYRIGGEEFLVLLPGADLDETAELAETLRRAIMADEECRALEVTMSFGVSASERGQAFSYDCIFALADAALYDAKHGGRNRAVVNSGSAGEGDELMRGVA